MVCVGQNIKTGGLCSLCCYGARRFLLLLPSDENYVYFSLLALSSCEQELGIHPNGETLVVATVYAGLGDLRHLTPPQPGLAFLQTLRLHPCHSSAEECSTGPAAETFRHDQDIMIRMYFIFLGMDMKKDKINFKNRAITNRPQPHC